MEISTPIQAIRKKCVECSNNQYKEVRNCELASCPLFPYRMGVRPETARKESGKTA